MIKYRILELIPGTGTVQYSTKIVFAGIGIIKFLKMLKIRFRNQFRYRNHSTSNSNTNFAQVKLMRNDCVCLGKSKSNVTLAEVEHKRAPQQNDLSIF